MSKQIFFVCGAPKSGTTWLQRLLDAHPDVVCSGEGHFIERLVLPIFKVVEQYNSHMTLVADRVYEGKPYYESITAGHVKKLSAELVLHLMSKRDPGGSARALGDKTPRYTHFLNQLLALVPGAKFVNIVRDPRDVAVSRLYHAFRAGYTDALSPGTEQRATLLRNSAEAWKSAVSNVSKFVHKHGPRLVEVRYEDLLFDPNEEAKRIFSFLGVDDRDLTVGSTVEASSFEKLSGRKPGTEDPLSFFRKGTSGTWCEILDQNDVQLILEPCGELMKQKRYSVSA